jgi:hypothetical protein
MHASIEKLCEIYLKMHRVPLATGVCLKFDRNLLLADGSVLMFDIYSQQEEKGNSDRIFYYFKYIYFNVLIHYLLVLSKVSQVIEVFFSFLSM